MEAATVGCVAPSARNPARSSITVEGIALFTVTAVRPINIDADLLTVICPQSTFIYIYVSCTLQTLIVARG
jgi:hypothetical protein